VIVIQAVVKSKLHQSTATASHSGKLQTSTLKLDWQVNSSARDIICEFILFIMSALETQTPCCYLQKVSSFFFFFLSSSSYSTFSLKFPLASLCGNKNNRLETSTLYAEWSQFAVDYFFGNLN